MTTTPQSNALETLVLQQLAHLIEDEKRLATSYPVLSAQADSPEVRQAFSNSLAELRRRAESLQRYVDALDTFAFVGSPVAALAS